MPAPIASHAVVIPCAAEKLDQAAPAVEIYSSANFRHILGAAAAHALDTERALGTPVKVLILSAKHGLIELGEVIAPYDTKMGDAASVSTETIADQILALGVTTIEAMLPAAYRNALQTASSSINDAEGDELPWITLLDVYEAAPGIGYQRGVASSLNRTNGLV